MFERIKGLLVPKDYLQFDYPCWDIEVTNRPGFFMEVLETVPDGTVLDIEDFFFDQEHVVRFEEFKSAAKRKVNYGTFWPKPEVLMIELNKESREVLKEIMPEVLGEIDHIRIYNENTLFFASFDLMDDVFLPSDFPESELIEWKEKGIIKGYELEE